PRTFWHIALEVAQEPMFLLLVTCGVLYFILGDPEEAMMLLGFVFVVMGITFFQERKTERALDALRDLSSPRALVIRSGEQIRIPGREVVPGDVLVLAEGDRVPADGAVIDSLNLSLDESLLTGESVPVRKIAAVEPVPQSMGKPGGDDLPFVYSGTMVVQGQGYAKILATGMKTELGKIGKALQNVETEESTLKVETGRLVRHLAILGFFSCLLVIVAYGLTRGNWTEGFLAGITLAMAMLPEEFPVVLTIFLALGAWRISQKQVLTRRVAAIETLGAATVLCSDKTGTLTQNRMTVVRLCTDGAEIVLAPGSTNALPEQVHCLAEFAILASQTDPFDPMEKAIRQVGFDHLANTEHLHDNWSLVREYPLSRELLAISRVWKSPEGERFIIAAKGSPEAIADLCHLSNEQKGELEKRINHLAESGLRIIGVASASFSAENLPSNQHDFSFEFIGLLGLEDPIRPTVPASVVECQGAGIRVVMITGDYPGTAQNIARQIGIAQPQNVLTGQELDILSPEELAERVKSVNIFARIVPEQKMKIVQALKQNGEITAMTGDGVNDAPALRSAHIGIAMGARGTDVAREASALVLLDDNFTSIAAAVKLGRRIFDNLQKAMSYIFAIHVPIAGLSLIPVLMKWDLILLPMHIVFLELLIDPSCSVVFEMEPEESDVMNRPPRPRDQPLFGRETLVISLIQGLAVLAFVLGVFLIGKFHLKFPVNECRALAFTTLIIANICLIIVNRSHTRLAMETLMTPNPAQWWVVFGGLFFLLLVLRVPFLMQMFKFEYLHINDIAICFGAGVGSLIWFEGFKAAFRRKVQKSPSQ
ncbi:MAG TPA: cation-translocating P-type ATPase, partial [Candidatus Ozemobacteraceae bacterium]|nr:cation-translocating P-type ATPase [Candidatus Ozemobacteraceae bacterium]